MPPNSIIFLRDHLFTLPSLAKFALVLVMLVAIPRLCRRLHIPAPVGLLIGGVIVGPYVLDIFGKVRPVVDFLAELGKLLLMFFAGLEIDLALFRRARNRSIALGIATTMFPLMLGTVVGLSFGYAAIPAVVIGSLLASHTLLGLPAVSRRGLGNLEPVTIAVGATVMSEPCHSWCLRFAFRFTRPDFLQRVWPSSWPKSLATSCWSCSA
jgi:Kef-type K+ transport system membrane component KefB